MPHDRLTEENGGDEPAAAYQFRVGKASLGACLVHGTIHGLSRNHYGLFDKVVRALDAFGVNRDMMFVGWWKKPVKVLKGEDVYVSTWKDEREGKRLLVIAHLGKPHVDQDVELEIVGRTALDKLTAPDPDYDFLYRRMKEFNVPALRAQLDLGDFGTKVISYDGKTLTYRLPFHSFGIVEVK